MKRSSEDVDRIRGGTMFSIFGRKKVEVEEVKKVPKKKIFKTEPFVTKEFLKTKPVQTITHEHVHEVRVHPKGGWQVILHGGKRALRKFDTKGQAVQFCKTQGLTYRVYKKDGTLQH